MPLAPVAARQGLLDVPKLALHVEDPKRAPPVEQRIRGSKFVDLLRISRAGPVRTLPPGPLAARLFLIVGVERAFVIDTPDLRAAFDIPAALLCGSEFV